MKTKHRKCIALQLIVVSILVVISAHKSNAQEGAYWIGLPFKNPAAISTPSDWVYGAFSHMAYDFGDYRETSYNLLTGAFDYRISPKAGTAGLDFYHLKIGKETTELIKANYAYDFKVFNSAILSFGVSGGITIYKNALSEYQLYPLDSNDPSFKGLKDEHYKTFNCNIGTFFHSERLSTGLSMKFREQIKSEDNYKINKPAVLTGVLAYRIVNNENFILTPNFMADYSNKDFNFIAGVHAEYKKTFWAGYQNVDFEDFHSLNVGIDLKQKFRIGYSYGFNDFLKTETLNTHEFVLGYRLR